MIIFFLWLGGNLIVLLLFHLLLSKFDFQGFFSLAKMQLKRFPDVKNWQFIQ